LRLYEDYVFPHAVTHIDCKNPRATVKLCDNLRAELKVRQLEGYHICKDTKHCIVTVEPFRKPPRKYQEEVEACLRQGDGIITVRDISDNNTKNAIRYELRMHGEDSHKWRFNTADDRKTIRIRRLSNGLDSDKSRT
jgi:hypothetical protein